MLSDRKLIKKSILFLAIALLLTSCAAQPPKYRPQKLKPSTPKPLYVDPIKKQSQALSIYRSATAFEDNYYDTGSIKDAEIAINKYEQYYTLTPNGSYACIALLKKAELLYMLNRVNDAKNELYRVKARKDFLNEFRVEIQYIENLLF